MSQSVIASLWRFPSEADTVFAHVCFAHELDDTDGNDTNNNPNKNKRYNEINGFLVEIAVWKWALSFDATKRFV